MTEKAEVALPSWSVRTHNPSERSDNRMHSDDVARAYGYRGALVPGVVVFSHLTHPLVAAFGRDWLEGTEVEVRFAKPAYDGDLLTIRATRTAGGTGSRSYEMHCHAEDGTELATMDTTRLASASLPDPRGDWTPGSAVGERPLVSWDRIRIGEPFPERTWCPSAAENREWCESCRDDLPIYRTAGAAPLHPGLCLRQANLALRERFVLPAWIHTASTMTLHEGPCVGRTYQVHAVPVEKWEHKGHQFVRLHVALRARGRTFWNILHTAIFRPRQAG